MLDRTARRPPDWAGLLDHFHLPRDGLTTDALQAAIGSAAESLLKDDGLMGCLDRLRHLPVPLPECVRTRFSSTSEEEARNIIRDALQQWHSPVSKLHLIRLLGDAPIQPACRRLARCRTQAFLQEHNIRQSDAFVQTTMLTVTEFGWWRDAMASPSSLRLLMGWAHASRLFEILLAEEAPPDAIDKGLAWLFLRMPADFVDPDSEGARDAIHPGNVSVEELVLKGLLYAAGDANGSACSPGDVTRVSEIAFPFQGAPHLPAPSLIDGFSATSNPTGSFLGFPARRAIEFLMDQERRETLEKMSSEDYLHEELTRLGNSPSASESWHTVLCLLGSKPPGDFLKRELQAMILKVDFVALAESDLEQELHRLCQVLRLAQRVRSEEIGRHVVKQARPLAEALSELPQSDARSAQGQPDAHRSPSEIDNVALEVLRLVCSQETDTQKRFDLFTELAWTYAQRRRNCRNILLATVRVVLDESWDEDLAPWRQLLLRLRSI